MSATPQSIAQWMLEQVNAKKWFYQEDAVVQIEKLFGKDFVYFNDNGNPAILPKVLSEFRKISKDTVVWDRSDKSWRRRQKFDAPSRSQD